MVAFLSYAHQDAGTINALKEELQDLAGSVWFDQSLTGGQKWWDEILAQIRDCQLFVLALSDHSLTSEACLAEMSYAQELHRPFLAVRILDQTLPSPDKVRETQILSFITRDVESVRALAKAVLKAGEPGPLPDPLPIPPPVPQSYKDRFDRLFGADLNLDEQLSLFARLKFDLESGSNTADATELIRRLYERPDLSWKVRQDIEALLPTEFSQVRPPPPGPSQDSAPTHEHTPGSPAWADTAPTGPPALQHPPALGPTGRSGDQKRRRRVLIGAGVVGVVAVLAAVTAVVLSSLDDTSGTTSTTQSTQDEGPQPPDSTVIGFQQFEGLWVGTVTETRLPTTYSIHLDLAATSDQISGRIDYPEFPCGGIVTFRSLENNVLTLVETITYGKELCSESGIMTVTLTSSNQAEWNYVSPEASAVLQNTN